MLNVNAGWRGFPCLKPKILYLNSKCCIFGLSYANALFSPYLFEFPISVLKHFG